MKLNISRKLLLGFFSVLLLLAAVSAITYVQFTKVDNDYSRSIDDSFAKVNLITEMENAALKEQIAVRGYLVNSEQDNLRKFNESSTLFTQKAEEFLNLNITSEAKAMVEEFIAVEDEYNKLAEEVIILKDQNQNAEITQLMKDRGNGLTENVTEVGERARLYQEMNIEDTSNDLSSKANASKTVIVIISIVAFVIGVAIALYISRIISKPVSKISKAANEIAKGNLAIEEIKIKNKDEIGDLANSFNLMLNNLRELIINVSSTSETVASSAEELMASAEQTSSATTQITNAIQEVAGGAEVQGNATNESANAVGEMLIGINRISDTSTNVAESASETTDEASAGNEMLQKVVIQMKSINNSTNR